MAKVVIVLLGVLVAAESVVAQDCLHGPTETAEQEARRRAALTATRAINTLQVNQPGGRTGTFLTRDQLARTPEAARLRQSTSEVVKSISLEPGTDVLPDWHLALDVTYEGYWFMIEDALDPCGFAYISNQAGVILKAEPIR